MDHRIIDILGLRPSNRLPVSYYVEEEALQSTSIGNALLTKSKSTNLINVMFSI